MAITLRNIKGEELSYEELDNNFIDLNTRLQDLESGIAAQTLALFDNTLVISNGNSVDLSPFLPFSGDYNDLENTPVVPALISQLQDVSTTVPQTGQVLKWNGSQWAPDTDDSNITDGADADTLNGQLPSYYLNYNNLTNKPTIVATLGELSNVSSAQPSSGQVLKWNGSLWAPSQDLTAGIQLTNLSIGTDAPPSANGGLSYNNVTGVFTYTPPVIPSVLTDLGITDGTAGQVLTTNGSGAYSFTTVQAGSASVAFEDLTSTPTTIAGYGITDALASTAIGDFSFSGTTINTAASAAITVTPDVTFSGTVTVSSFASAGVGNFSVSSAASVNITAADDVNITGDVTTFSNVIKLTPLTSAPTSPSLGMFAVADGINWDPAVKGTGRAYPVFFDGAVWTPLY